MAVAGSALVRCVLSSDHAFWGMAEGGCHFSAMQRRVAFAQLLRSFFTQISTINNGFFVCASSMGPGAEAPHTCARQTDALTEHIIHTCTHTGDMPPVPPVVPPQVHTSLLQAAVPLAPFGFSSAERQAIQRSLAEVCGRAICPRCQLPCPGTTGLRRAPLQFSPCHTASPIISSSFVRNPENWGVYRGPAIQYTEG